MVRLVESSAQGTVPYAIRVPVRGIIHRGWRKNPERIASAGMEATLEAVTKPFSRFKCSAIPSGWQSVAPPRRRANPTTNSNHIFRAEAAALHPNLNEQVRRRNARRSGCHRSRWKRFKCSANPSGWQTHAPFVPSRTQRETQSPTPSPAKNNPNASAARKKSF